MKSTQLLHVNVLIGFFNLIVYMSPRIMRYYGKGIPFTDSISRSNTLTSFRCIKKNSNITKEAEGTSITKEHHGVRKISSASPADVTGKGTRAPEEHLEMEENGIDGEGGCIADNATGGDNRDDNEMSIEEVNTSLERDAIDELARIVAA